MFPQVKVNIMLFKMLTQAEKEAQKYREEVRPQAVRFCEMLRDLLHSTVRFAQCAQ